MSVQQSEPLTAPVESSTAPQRPRLHYAWIVLCLCAMTVFMSAPGQSYSVAAFIDPMLDGLGWLRTDYSLAYLVATLAGGMILPFVGRAVDRFGARTMLPIIATLLGAACCWMSSIHHLAGLYAGFTMIRCLGQGSLTLISNWMIGAWFEKRRGFASGLVGLAGAFSVMTVPQINEALIGRFGWRNAWLFLAGAVWIGLVLPARLFVRDRPEDCELSVDWNHERTDETDTPNELDDENEPTLELWTVWEALRTTTFWKLIAMGSTSSMVGTGLVFHQVSLLGMHGIERTDALALLGVQAFFATIVGLVAGWLTDRIAARILLTVCMVALTLAIVLLLWMPSPIWSIAYACLIGLCGGIMRTTGSVVWINCYGHASQGTIQGAALAIMVASAAFGPLPLAYSFDHSGSYGPALWSFLVIPIIAGLAVLTAHPPKRSQILAMADRK